MKKYPIGRSTGNTINIARRQSTLKTSESCFFQLIRLNPTTNTVIKDYPTRFLFLAPIGKYLDEIFPDPEVSIWSPNIPDIDQTGPVLGLFYVCICCKFVIFSFICWCISMFIHPIYRFKSSDWLKEGHMTWVILDSVHVWKVIHMW